MKTDLSAEAMASNAAELERLLAAKTTAEREVSNAKGELSRADAE